MLTFLLSFQVPAVTTGAARDSASNVTDPYSTHVIV